MESDVRTHIRTKLVVKSLSPLKIFHNYKVCELLLLLQVVLHSFYWDTLYRGLGTEQRSFMGIQNILLPLFRVNKDMVWTLSLTILNH